MSGTTYLVDNTDPASIEALIDAFDIRGTTYEDLIRTALTLADRTFTMIIDPLSQQGLTPLQDQFTFDMDTDALIVFSDRPASLIDALVEMAMFLRGFNTMIGVEDEWKVNVAMGAWRQVRASVKATYGLELSSGKDWSAPLDEDAVEDFDLVAFGTVVFLASRPDVEVIFPSTANNLVVSAYDRLVRIMEAIALNISLDDHLTFNRRLNRALLLIEDSILPHGASLDDSFGLGGLSDRFFDDDLDDTGL